MKERIKKFWNDHDEEICFAAGYAIAAVVVGTWAVRHTEAHRIAMTQTVIDPETKAVKGTWVVLTNGKKIPFFQPTEVK